MTLKLMDPIKSRTVEGNVNVKYQSIELEWYVMEVKHYLLVCKVILLSAVISAL